MAAAGSGDGAKKAALSHSLCRYADVSPRKGRACFADNDAVFLEFRQRARAFCEGMREAHDQAEVDGQFPRSVYREAARQGFYCMNIPREFGGLGLMDPRYSAIVNEETVRAGVDGYLGILGSDMVLPYLLNYATAAQKAQWLPAIARGEVIIAVAMSEPHTGSDVSNVHTTAVRDGDDYVLNGTKFWISHGSIADLVIVVARTGAESAPRHASLSLFLLTNVRVPASAVLGPLGGGFKCLMRNLARERMAVAIAAVASCQVGLDQTLQYVKQRRMFGRRLGDLQYPALKLAELKTETHVGRVFVDDCLSRLARGDLTGEVAAMAKWWCTALQQRVLDTCVQFHGGYGFLAESPVKLGPKPIGLQWLAARIQPIYAGSNEVMKEIIAKRSGLKPRSKL